MKKQFLNFLALSQGETSTAFDLNKIQRRNNGVAVMKGRPIRSGNIEYLAYEVAELFPEKKQGDVLKGNISSDELSKLTQSLAGSVLTWGHPFEFVNADNLKDNAVGYVGS